MTTMSRPQETRHVLFHEAAAMQRVTEKDRWVLITDPAEQEALTALGKWREDKPTTVMRGDQMWALINDVFKAWREARANSGKNLCRHE